MYTGITSIQGENLKERGGQIIMTSYELIWRLIVLLLISNNDNESLDQNKE